MDGRSAISVQRTKLLIPTDEYRSRPIPNFGKGAKLGECFVAVTDLPPELEQFMEVNPRSPKRSRGKDGSKGRLSGPVVEGIRETLLENPTLMAVMRGQLLAPGWPIFPLMRRVRGPVARSDV